MKYLDEYRNPRAARRYAELLAEAVTRPWTLMEVCGGQTHAVVRFGLDQLFPPGLSLVHGPGCPVCVTPLEQLDRAMEIARRPEVIFCSFGDMLRVPGTEEDLQAVKAGGADVRVVYSPLDAVELARVNPGREVVFFAVGFETTAPANAVAALTARREGLRNFSLLVSHVRVPPALELLLEAPDNQVQGFLAAGHVCTVMGWTEYESIAERWRVPMVVTGFEPLDLLQGVLMCVRQLEAGRHEVENQYARSVERLGNRPARNFVERVFEVVFRPWRGIGLIPKGGLALRAEFASLDAERRFPVAAIRSQESGLCRAGQVLRGVMRPADCPAFGTMCTPEHPLGAPMVSNEGACAAYYRFRR